MGRIGIMGGTFDPIHNGHLLLGQQACQEYYLDEVWYMPSGQPPHKKDRSITHARFRCEMTKLAIQDFPSFHFSDFETKREGNTYTAQTLELLHQSYPQHHFFFIIGADSLYEIEKWFHPEIVLTATEILVAYRQYKEHSFTIDQQIHMLTKKYGARILKLHWKGIDAASEDIRELAAAGLSLNLLVPPKVEEYIRIHHLYQKGE